MSVGPSAFIHRSSSRTGTSLRCVNAPELEHIICGPSSLASTFVIMNVFHQMSRPPQRHLLLPARPRDPTASCFARRPAAASSPQVPRRHNASIEQLQLLLALFSSAVLLSGAVFSLGESGRSESQSMLRLPKEERADVTQLRKVNHMQMYANTSPPSYTLRSPSRVSLVTLSLHGGVDLTQYKETHSWYILVPDAITQLLHIH